MSNEDDNKIQIRGISDDLLLAMDVRRRKMNVSRQDMLLRWLTVEFAVELAWIETAGGRETMPDIFALHPDQQDSE